MHVIVGKKKFNLVDCESFQSRFMGLMFVKDFDYCLRFKKCNSIHTFFMKSNIDVIMTNKENVVIAIYKNVPKNRIIIIRKAHRSYFFFKHKTK